MTNKNIEIPELTCEGCKCRDRMIKSLAEEIDRNDAVKAADIQTRRRQADETRRNERTAEYVR